MANGEARVRCALLVATLFLGTVQSTSDASKLDLHISDNINRSCPWRINFGDGEANTDRCIDKFSITFSGHGPGEESDGDPNGPSSGYESLWGEHLYKLHSRAARWHAAKAACEREGAHLVVLNSPEEATAVRALIARPAYENATVVHAGFYTGLITPLNKTLPFSWHERWVRTNPGARACGRVDGDGFLSIGACDDEQPFVCELEAPPAPPEAPPEDPAAPPTMATAAPPTVATSAQPPSPHSDYPIQSTPTQRLSDLVYYALKYDYEMAPGWNTSYYRWLSHSTSWERAEYYCTQIRGHLASFESEEEIEAVIQLIQTKGKSSGADWFYRRSVVGVCTAELVTLQGDLVSETGYDRWTKPEKDRKCFAVDHKLLLYEITRESTVVCEIDVSGIDT